jgi:hypothetical protein
MARVAASFDKHREGDIMIARKIGKFFNTGGPGILEDHYMLDPLRRIKGQAFFVVTFYDTGGESDVPDGKTQRKRKRNNDDR